MAISFDEAINYFKYNFKKSGSTCFSTFRRQNQVLTRLKSASKTHSEMFVRPSKIFVWEGYISNILTKASTINPGFNILKRRNSRYSEQKIAQLHPLLYPSQTKILEGGTKDEMQMFDTLCKGSWPKLSTHALENCFEHMHFIFCSSFQNLRLGSIYLTKELAYFAIFLFATWRGGRIGHCH
jgi:hypothetical protein